MGKTKQKNHNEIRHLQGENRQLKKKIRNLEKELSYYKKRDHLNSPQDVEVTTDTEDTFTNLIKCEGEEGCYKGVFIEMHILDKVYGTCNVCGRRKRLK